MIGNIYCTQSVNPAGKLSCLSSNSMTMNKRFTYLIKCVITEATSWGSISLPHLFIFNSVIARIKHWTSFLIHGTVTMWERPTRGVSTEQVPAFPSPSATKPHLLAGQPAPVWPGSGASLNNKSLHYGTTRQWIYVCTWIDYKLRGYYFSFAVSSDVNLPYWLRRTFKAV